MDFRNTLSTIFKKNQKPKKERQKRLTTQQNKKWITFTYTYHSPLIRKITNLFKHTNLSISFRATNTIYQQLTDKPTNTNPSEICQIKCSTFNSAHIGQSGRSVIVKHKEHMRYIRNNNPTSAYAVHKLNGIWHGRRNIKTTNIIKQGNNNELLGDTLYASLPSSYHIDRGATG